MTRISIPAACKDRIADSRPEPGPLTWTSSFLIPISLAFIAALSAATCAAKGVLFLEPLKPFEPEELYLRIKKLLKLYENINQSELRIEFGDFIFDTKTQDLKKNNKVKLSKY